MNVLSRPDIQRQLVARGDSPSPRLVFDCVSDQDLVARACGGDRHAFEVLLRRHYDSIHRVARRLTGSTSDAEDIAQDVCCALIEKLGSFKGEAKFTTWLFGIVVNAFRDHRRRSRTLRAPDCLRVAGPCRKEMPRQTGIRQAIPAMPRARPQCTLACQD